LAEIVASAIATFFSRAHARNSRTNRENSSQPLAAVAVTNCAKVRIDAQSARFGAPEGVSNRWQPAAWKWCAATCQRFQTPLEVTKPEAYVSGSPV